MLTCKATTWLYRLLRERSWDLRRGEGPGHDCLVLFGDLRAGIGEIGAGGHWLWHFGLCTPQRPHFVTVLTYGFFLEELYVDLLDLEKETIREKDIYKMNPPPTSYRRDVPPGWRPGDASYPLRSYFDKLKLWYRICNVEDELVGPLIASRLYGRAYVCRGQMERMMLVTQLWFTQLSKSWRFCDFVALPMGGAFW